MSKTLLFKPKVLVAVPIKPTLNSKLVEKVVTLIGKLPAANPEIEFTTIYDASPIPKMEGVNLTPWNKVFRARNLLLSKVNVNNYDYVLWIDADVVDFPLDMPTRLIAGNPNGISAPMVIIEGGNTFYDYTAFIQQGTDTQLPEIHPTWERVQGRNLHPNPPYWNTEPTETVVEMDCVGTVTMVPTWIYKKGFLYENHPTFTDHFPVCKGCRDNGEKVTVDRSITALHAYLPNYGECWH